MKTRTLLLIAVVITCSLVGYSQSVVVTRKKVTYTRPKAVSEYKKTFTINYPKIKAATPAISRRIEAALSYEQAFGINIEEERTEIQWLANADYEVLYNNNGLLDLMLTIDGSGAYPDGSQKSVIVDTKAGNRVLPGEVFVYPTGLVSMVNKAQKKEIADRVAEIKNDPESEEKEPEKLFENARFTTDNLKGFAINEKGVTFYYDYGLPHIIQALEPDGEYFFTWAEMKPYIRINGLLGRFVH